MTPTWLEKLVRYDVDQATGDSPVQEWARPNGEYVKFSDIAALSREEWVPKDKWPWNDAWFVLVGDCRDGAVDRVTQAWALANKDSDKFTHVRPLPEPPTAEEGPNE